MGGGRRGGVWFPRDRDRDGRGGRVRDRERRANEDALDYVEQMAEVSAGRFYQNDVTDLKATFALIADELRKHYRLGYYPPDSEGDYAVHQIKVKVARADVAVRSRGSYRAK